MIWSDQLIALFGMTEGSDPPTFEEHRKQIHPDDYDLWEGTVKRSAETGSYQNFEFRNVLPDGTSRHLHATGRCIKNAAGKVVEMVGTAQDVTEAKRVEREMRQTIAAMKQVKAELESARDSAEAANLAKSAFLANMSHELRTPLTAILGFAGLLLDEPLSLGDQQSYLATIRRNGEHLLTLLNDVLDLSKIEAGGLRVERIECDPTHVVADVLSLMRRTAAEKRLQLHVFYRTDMPTRIHTDPTRLRQVLMNLLGNAIKFTRQGEVRIEVGLELGKPGDGSPAGGVLRFDVLDTGIGIEAAAMEKLFEPFTQADASTTRQFGGTGLGLTISRQLVELLGGELTATSEPERGSCFTFTVAVGKVEGGTMQTMAGEALVDQAVRPTSGPPSASETEVPRVTPAAGAAPEMLGGGAQEMDRRVATPAAEAAGPSAPLPQSPLAGCRLLLAEDGPDNQRLINHLLTRAGAVVTLANNGREAVDCLLGRAGEEFDAVLMDMQMPILDGYAAVRCVRDAGYARPIIALTAHSLAGDREKCLAAGCDDYLTKPLRKPELIAAIRQAAWETKRAA